MVGKVGTRVGLDIDWVFSNKAYSSVRVQIRIIDVKKMSAPTNISLLTWKDNGDYNNDKERCVRWYRHSNSLGLLYPNQE